VVQERRRLRRLALVLHSHVLVLVLAHGLWIAAFCASVLGAVDPQPLPWSFQPIRDPKPPVVDATSLVRTPVDRFVLARLEERGLTLSPEADRVTLIRRLYLDLLGLPAEPEAIEGFAADSRPDAYERLLDRVLSSPHYGERWGRHWLDVIAFGETHGFEVNTPRENAWPYRDYVIGAFNADRPYPEFIRDQLAGDVRGEDAATGFLVAAAALLPGQIGKDEESMLLARQDELNEMVLGTGAAFLGLTIQCARCHDHKFDPVSQRDYYAMQAMFGGVRHGERPLHRPDFEERKLRFDRARARLNALELELSDFEPLARVASAADPPPPPRRDAVDPRRTVDRFAPVRATRLRFTVLAASSLEPCLDELEVLTADGSRRNVALASIGTRARASSTLPGSGLHQLEHINDGRYGNGRSWISNEPGAGWVELEFPDTFEVDRVIWGRDREQKFTDRLATRYRIEVAAAGAAWTIVATSEDRRDYVLGVRAEPLSLSSHAAEILPAHDRERWRRLCGEHERLRAEVSLLAVSQVVYAGRFEPQPPATYRLQRGDPKQQREMVSPATPALLGRTLALSVDAVEHERRLALAEWIGSEQHSLTARVMVNRLWQHHFGEGIVRTPSDFGHNGAAPEHPELLDWLATAFTREGWSVKRMHRLICSSAVYRQSSAPNREASAVDADARWLWRFPPRRLEAEVLRDSILRVSGALDGRMGGPGFSVFKPNDNYVRVYDPKEQFGPAEWRRMVYATKVRMAQDGTFGAFDCPDAGQPQPKRSRSTTAIQALNLFNSEFVAQQAAIFAERVRRETGQGTLPAQVRHGFRLALGREPDPSEAAVSARLVEQHGLEALCRVLLNTSEFAYLP
jgi:hypothetical protein